MISRTTKYALNVLRCLAREPTHRTPTDRLAHETGIPANYLSKILSQLRKHDIVEGEKGWRGGFRLQPSALDRTIRSIDEIFDKRPRRSTENGRRSFRRRLTSRERSDNTPCYTARPARL